MSLDHIILGLLSEPLSGYDLKTYFDKMINHFWAAEQSQIYRSLKKLEQEGLLNCAEAPPSKGPARKIYSLTAKGRAFLHQWLRDEPLIDKMRATFVAQLCFMGDLEDPQQTISFLEQLQLKQRQSLGMLKSLDHVFGQSNPNYPDSLPWRDYHFALTLDMGIFALESRIEWCERTITRLKRRVAGENP